MGNKVCKRRKNELRKKRNGKRIKKYESQDEKGISRKALKSSMNPRIFLILKIISIVIIPIVYFVYSPLLIICMIFSMTFFVFAKRTERAINHTFIKANHLHIPKFDSVLATIVLIITIAGSCLGFQTPKKNPFGNVLMDIKMTLENTGSCLTGARSIIKGNRKMSFGNGQTPPSFPSGSKRPSKMDMNDLPVEMMFSMMLSSVNSVLIFMVSISGAVWIIVYTKRKTKFDKEMSEVISDEY